MKIHELPAQTTAADADVVAVDNGTTTQKMTVANLGKKITEDATPAFTSGDSSTATSWTNVAAVTSGLPMKNILSRITTMMKNVRYLYSLLGTTDITGSGKNTVSGAIGGTSISDIGDGTLTGAVDALNGKIGETDISGIGGTVTEAISKLNTDLSPSGLAEEIINYTYNNKGVSFYFRGNATTLSVLVTKSNESMTLPTSWTTIGTLKKFKPASDRYISLISSNGLTLTMRIWADGAVSIIAHSSNAYWLQSSGTVIYK